VIGYGALHIFLRSHRERRSCRRFSLERNEGGKYLIKPARYASWAREPGPQPFEPFQLKSVRQRSDCDMIRALLPRGPVAQLGARFHGMEEVKGSNPFRSTKTFQTLTAPSPEITPSPESKWSPNRRFRMGSSQAPCEFPFLPTIRLLSSTTYLAWAAWAPFSTLVVCWRRQQLLSA
jgi:hypothetical protein